MTAAGHSPFASPAPLSFTGVAPGAPQLWPTPGGVHPPANKQQSLREPICRPPLPEILILPLQQHIGNPATALVKVGQLVARGQLIAAPNGAVSVGVHAPTSGTITAIGDYPVAHPSGQSAPCIALSPDGAERWGKRPQFEYYEKIAPAQLLTAIRDAGIAGLGGAGFPSAVKLTPPQPIHTLIINAAECEPYITADEALIRERAADIVAGIQILAHILGRPERLVIGIENDKPEAQDALTTAIDGTGINLVVFPAKYPSGGEKQLIQLLTGKEVPSGQIPAQIGVLCHNVATAYSIARAILHGEPQISRITTATGAACALPRNYEVLIGTPIRHLLALSGFSPNANERVIMGGPMMGFTLTDLDVPVIKTTNCLLAPSHEEMPPLPPAQACIRCGLCAQACPASLLPQQLFWYGQSGNHERLLAHDLFDCIECGACSYVCPSNIPLVQYYRASKGEIRAQEKERIASDLARQRFETHQRRVAHQAEQREAKRAARRNELAGATAAIPAGAVPTGAVLKGAVPTGAAPKDENATDEKATAQQPAEDVIQAALRRAMEKQASPQQQLGALQRRLLATQHVRDAAHEKWLAAGTENQPAAQLDGLRAKLEEADLRLQTAQKKLAAFGATNDPEQDTESGNSP